MDPSAGDDATTDGGPNVPDHDEPNVPDHAEPDLRDAGAGPPQSATESARAK